jgi:hypothetical protein
MKVKSESYSIDTAEAGFIHIRQSRVAEDGDETGGELWFERDSLPWVVQALQAATGEGGAPKARTQSGQDSLSVFEGGPEQAPVINFYNVRPAGAPHAGSFARVFSAAVARKLAAELAGLGTSSPRPA